MRRHARGHENAPPPPLPRRLRRLARPAILRRHPHDITLGGINFVVFHKDTRAEVVRLGYLKRRDRLPVPQLMEQAVEQTTGCKPIPGSMVTGLPGDTGEARFRLNC